MTIAEQLRAAALGPPPEFSHLAGSWLGPAAWEKLFEYCSGHEWHLWYAELDDDGRRALMLFVACAEADE